MTTDLDVHTRLLPADFYLQDSLVVAKALLGCLLVHDGPNGRTSGRITETEAYKSDDPASHAFRGQNRRNATMFGPSGRAYVYFTYGMHYCMNAVCRPAGIAEGVLLRSLEPIEGLELMRSRRGLPEEETKPFQSKANPTSAVIRAGRALCGGPGKLCQALGIDGSMDGMDITGSSSLTIIRPKGHVLAEHRIAASSRIGITQGVDLPWRFYLENEPYISRK